MTAEEDRLIAFLVGETDRVPKPADYRVPRPKLRSRVRKLTRTKQIPWSATARKASP